jgi:hypothetical protein
MIGLEPHELEWMRLVVKLLRHPDPLPAELVRQALTYVNQVAESGAGVSLEQPAVGQAQARR